ncbi:MAG: hypothetical protein A2204_00080 [Elusimicrobia bacterium RIFOXYA1_FULL_47_7]|nr:MAG: hypothetical protein A2204_00080 [Elusimicrobia bacterium RIFOXYA1_FULL_47_7]
MKRPFLGQILIESGVINNSQLQEVLLEQKTIPERIGKLLVRRKWATEQDILGALSLQHNMQVISLSNLKIDVLLSEMVPAKFANRYNIIPIKKEGGVLTVATSDPLDIHAFDDLRLMLDLELNTVLASEKEINAALKKLYGLGAETMELVAEKDELTRQPASERQAEEPEAEEDASIIKFVNQVIEEAYRDGATDIHIEPYEDDIIVRYRIDGILHAAPIPSSVKKYRAAVISRIKIMAGMDIAEKRLPQDGRLKYKMGNEYIDMRISTLPVLHGESIDLRILPRAQMFLGLELLGLPVEYQKRVESLIRMPHGIMLVTGPTGHGKTTTLYACLSKINTTDKKIITIEEPVEYQLKGINQIPVHSRIGLTFANGLRAILRQDPDVIMVGEIRDQETAEIAIRSSLTGHLVFSTLHSNNSAGAITRLIDMGIEPYLISSSVEAIMAQRLIRLLCPKCRVRDNQDTSSLESSGFKILPDGAIFTAGPGCEECRHTGYKGRTGIYELLIMDDEIRQLVVEKAAAGDIFKKAVSRGLVTLREDGWKKVKAGLTSIAEIIRVTNEGEV